MDEVQFERLIRIEAKLDNFLGTHGDHETRLRRLERAMWIASGFSITAGGSLGALVSQLMGG